MIGTHALLSERINFQKLGLVIIDEQHRFGVEQRKSLRDVINTDGTTPHFLSMTATPIPRSLALALCGDLDVSYISHLAIERKPIITFGSSRTIGRKRMRLYENKVKKGRQVFVICPLIQADK